MTDEVSANPNPPVTPAPVDPVAPQTPVASQPGSPQTAAPQPVVSPPHPQTQSFGVHPAVVRPTQAFYQKVWFWIVLALAMLVISIVGTVAGTYVYRAMNGGATRTFPGNGTIMRNFNGNGNGNGGTMPNNNGNATQ